MVVELKKTIIELKEIMDAKLSLGNFTIQNGCELAVALMSFNHKETGESIELTPQQFFEMNPKGELANVLSMINEAQFILCSMEDLAQKAKKDKVLNITPQMAEKLKKLLVLWGN